MCPNNKKIEFIGRIVSIEEQDGAYVVALADRADQPDQYIVLQRAIDEDEQDASLGLNTYFLEVCARDCSGYGGVQQARLYQDRLELSLQPSNRYADGLQEIVVWLGLSTSETNRLAKQLALIFRETLNNPAFTGGLP